MAPLQVQELEADLDAASRRLATAVDDRDKRTLCAFFRFVAESLEDAERQPSTAQPLRKLLLQRLKCLDVTDPASIGSVLQVRNTLQAQQPVRPAQVPEVPDAPPQPALRRATSGLPALTRGWSTTSSETQNTEVNGQAPSPSSSDSEQASPPRGPRTQGPEARMPMLLGAVSGGAFLDQEPLFDRSIFSGPGPAPRKPLQSPGDDAASSPGGPKAGVAGFGGDLGAETSLDIEPNLPENCEQLWADLLQRRRQARTQENVGEDIDPVPARDAVLDARVGRASLAAAPGSRPRPEMPPFLPSAGLKRSREAAGAVTQLVGGQMAPRPLLRPFLSKHSKHLWGFCGHGKRRRLCPHCSPEGLCRHGQSRKQCTICLQTGEGQLTAFRGRPVGGRCVHDRVAGRCGECNPCPHGKAKYSCSACRPCEHGRLRYNCPLCKRCEHGVLRKECTLCLPVRQYRRSGDLEMQPLTQPLPPPETAIQASQRQALAMADSIEW